MKGWICLSDPQNTDIPSFNPAPAPAKWASGDNTFWTLRGNLGILILIVILLFAVAAGTVVLIRLFRKRKNDNV